LRSFAAIIPPPLNSKLKIQNSKLQKLVPLLLDWFSANARDLPWRKTRDPYAIWVSEIMLQQTQVKTVMPYWNRWMRELPTIESVAKASPDKIHKLWEGLGYYTRARNLQKAAKQIVAGRRDELHESQNKKSIRDSHSSSLRFPEKFEDVLALPGIGRYTAGAICSIAFNQPKPILDGNVIRVLTRTFSIAENPKEKETNKLLWRIAEELVSRAAREDARPTKTNSCSHLNQSLMELGALVCTPRNPSCSICPVKRLCVAFKENRIEELPNLGKREAATARHFIAFVVERNGKFLVRQRPAGIVNAHLWEFPNVEMVNGNSNPEFAAKNLFGIEPQKLKYFHTLKHSVTRYRITLEAFRANLGWTSYTSPKLKKQSGTRKARPSEKFSEIEIWKTPAQMKSLAFTAAHKKLATLAAKAILPDR
jgi:A/G-specific adenine glycosylase